MHHWNEGDKVDWAGISDAAYWLGKNLRRWGRISVTDTKEKYGTARVHVSWGWDQIHSITHPGFHYRQYPLWLWRFDCMYLSRCLPLVNWAVVPLQQKLYRFLYKRALKKWPHLAGEILMGADWTELLLGLDSRLVFERTGPQSSTVSWQDPASRPEPEEDLP